MKRLIAIVLTAASAVCHGGIGATQLWTSNYVKRVVDSLPLGTGISADEARRFLSGIAEDFLNGMINSSGYGEDDMTTSNGVSTVYGVVQSNGVPVIVRREYDLRISVEYDPPFQGARIVSSALDEYPVEALFGLSDDGRLTCKTLAGTQNWFDLSDGANGPEIVYESESVVYNSLYLGYGVQIAKYQRQSGEMKLVGTFTVEPYALTGDEFAAATDGDAGENVWTSEARNKRAVIVLRWLPRSATLSRTALKASGGSQGSCAIPFYYTGPGMIDYNEVYPPASDEYEWQPSRGYPPGAWEDAGNWHTDFPVTATFTETDDEGNIVTFTREIPNQAVFNAIKGNYELNIPPWPYTYPKLVYKPTFKCEKYGHVWKRCVCSVCGETRAHDIPDIDEHEGQCAECLNKDTGLKMVNGEYKVEVTDSICGEHDKTYTPSKHAGWHHTGVSVDAIGNYPQVYCSCACGNFSERRYVLTHRKTRATDEYGAELDAEYVDANTHRIKYICTRGNCYHEMWEYESHNVEPKEGGEEPNLNYNDAQTHWATGQCKDCKQDIDALVDHLWGYYGGDENHKCKCPCFKSFSEVDTEGVPLASAHEWGSADYINQDDASRICTVMNCWRCGKPGRRVVDEIVEVDDEADMDHTGAWMTDGKAGTENADHHWCNCASVFETHDFSETEPVVCDGRHNMSRLGGCGYNLKKGGGDSREGTDSISVEPDGPTFAPGVPPSPPQGPPVPPPVPPPGKPPSKPPFPPPPSPPTPPGPLPGKNPPFLPPPDPYPTDGGDSATVDPNSVTNNWTNVSAPFGGPRRPPPPWTF